VLCCRPVLWTWQQCEVEPAGNGSRSDARDWAVSVVFREKEVAWDKVLLSNPTDQGTSWSSFIDTTEGEIPRKGEGRGGRNGVRKGRAGKEELGREAMSYVCREVVGCYRGVIGAKEAEGGNTVDAEGPEAGGKFAFD
jgi:hypothetical protein